MRQRACTQKENENLSREAASAQSKLLALLKKVEYRSEEEMALDCIARMEVDALHALPKAGPSPDTETLGVATETVEVGERRLCMVRASRCPA